MVVDISSAPALRDPAFGMLRLPVVSVGVIRFRILRVPQQCFTRQIYIGNLSLRGFASRIQSHSDAKLVAGGGNCVSTRHQKKFREAPMETRLLSAQHQCHVISLMSGNRTWQHHVKKDILSWFEVYM